MFIKLYTLRCEQSFFGAGHKMVKNMRKTRIISDPPWKNQQKGDNTGTHAMHGHASVTTDMVYAHL